MKVLADKHRCSGTAMCVSVASKTFALDPTDRRVQVLDDTATADDIEDVEDAVDMCPVSALTLLDTTNDE